MPKGLTEAQAIVWCRQHAGQMVNAITATGRASTGRIVGVALRHTGFKPAGSPIIENKDAGQLDPSLTGYEYFFKPSEARDGFVRRIENVELIVDQARYPHQCPFCKKPAYIGAINMLDCSAKCR